MKEISKPRKKSFFRKHWPDILFFVFLILFIFPATRIKIQSWIVVPLTGSPEIIENNESAETVVYNIALKDLKGIDTNMNQSKGKPLLINFWATWCTPCIAEMPGLVQLHSDFADQMDFYFVSNESSDKLTAFLTKKGYDIPVFRPISRIPESFDTSSIPSTYLIDKNGHVVAKAQGMADWHNHEVRALMQELITIED